MEVIIKKLKKKLKARKSINKKLNINITEYHNDIIILDQSNFILEQENTQLKEKIREYEEIYLKSSKTLFEKKLDTIMIEAKKIKKEDSSFYTSALKYMSGYIQALQLYSKGDTKKILQMLKEYKAQTKEAQDALHEIKYGKNTLFKKVDKISKEIKVFKSKVDNCI